MAKRQINVPNKSGEPKAPKAPKKVAAAAVPVQVPAPTVTPEVAKVPAGVNRTAATIAKGATNFGGTVSDRDEAYLVFWASLAKKQGGSVTVADIAKSGRRPNYDGSNKPHDAGVAVRLQKAGLLGIEDNGHKLVFTSKAKDLAAYKSA